jgi:segregation and condensation protein B
MQAKDSDTLEEAQSPPPEERLVEAMLFLGGPPLTPARAGDAVRGLTLERLADAVDRLNHAYRAHGRPYHIQMREQGYELVLRPRYVRVVDRLFGSPREARLSAQALDVLALVAYRQPVSRPEVEALRGADSAGPLRQLVRLGLIAVQRGGAQESRDVAYGTTTRFLTLFQLRSLDDLPRTQDLQRM